VGEDYFNPDLPLESNITFQPIFLVPARTTTWPTTTRNAPHPWNSPRLRLDSSCSAAERLLECPRLAPNTRLSVKRPQQIHRLGFGGAGTEFALGYCRETLLAGVLPTDGGGRTLSVGREAKMEIPVQILREVR